MYVLLCMFTKLLVLIFTLCILCFRWARAINQVEESLKSAGYGYAYNDHLGYITTCPSNVGTGLRASVMLKLPKLYKKMGVHKLEELADSYGLQARGGRGEHSPPGMCRFSLMSHAVFK